MSDTVAFKSGSIGCIGCIVLMDLWSTLALLAELALMADFATLAKWALFYWLYSYIDGSLLNLRQPKRSTSEPPF